MARNEIEDVLDILDVPMTRPIDSLAERRKSCDKLDRSGPVKMFTTMEQGHPRDTCAHGVTRTRHGGEHDTNAFAMVSGTTNRFANSTYREKSVAALMTSVRRASETGRLSAAVVKLARGLLNQVIDAPNIRRSHKTGVPEGAVFIAARQCNCPRTIHEIASMFDVDDQVVSKGTRRVSTALAHDSPHCSRLKPGSPSSFVSRFLDIVREHSTGVIGAFAHTIDRLQMEAQSLAHTAHFNDEAPALIAAAVVVRSAKVRPSQMDALARRLGVKTSALKRCVKVIDDEGLGVS